MKIKKPKEKIIRTTLRLPEDLWSAVRIAAIQERMSAANFVIKVLETHLKKGGH